jgi:hypothetical protein
VAILKKRPLWLSSLASTLIKEEKLLGYQRRKAYVMHLKAKRCVCIGLFIYFYFKNQGRSGQIRVLAIRSIRPALAG